MFPSTLSFGDKRIWGDAPFMGGCVYVLAQTFDRAALLYRVGVLLNLVWASLYTVHDTIPCLSGSFFQTAFISVEKIFQILKVYHVFFTMSGQHICYHHRLQQHESAMTDVISQVSPTALFYNRIFFKF